MQPIHAAFVGIAALLIFGVGATAVAQAVPDEAVSIGVLKSDAGWLEKQTACRNLRQNGTAACVPDLAALLPDKEWSQLARFALEAMPCAEAGQALRDALPKVEGITKTGIIGSLGVRRDAKAVPLLIPSLRDPDDAVACAAAGAIGRIATEFAVEALMDFRASASDSVRPALAEGLLAAGQRLVQQGKQRQAVAIYQELFTPGWPMHMRSGAFRGLAEAQPDQAPRLLIGALEGNEPLFRDMAAQLVAETSGEGTTALYTGVLPKLPVAGQVALLRGLADRKDPAARPTVAAAAQNPDRQVKIAALKALAVLGNAADAPALSALLGSEDAELADTAKASLTILQGEGVDAAIAETVAGASPAVRVKLLDLLTERRSTEATPLALANLNDTDVSVRIAGLQTLATMGQKDQIPAVMPVIVKATDPTERQAAEKALSNIGVRNGDEILAMLLVAMPDSNVDMRVVMLRVVARIGGPKALEAVLAAIKDPNAPIGAEAADLLGAWPTIDAAPALFELAQSEDLNRKELGLRGFVRLAGTVVSVEDRAGMIAKATALAPTPETKKIILSAWGSLPAEQSLAALQPYLDDAAVQNEASVAILSVAAELVKKNPNAKPAAAEAVNAVVAKCADADIHDRAQKALAGLQ
jgi:HEAT repeat protein